jgi:hypothetical protein
MNCSGCSPACRALCIDYTLYCSVSLCCTPTCTLLHALPALNLCLLCVSVYQGACVPLPAHLSALTSLLSAL